MAEASPACRLVSLMPFASDCFQPGPVNSHDPGASRQARLWFYGADSPHQPQTTMSNSNWVRTQLMETYTIFVSNQRGALNPRPKGPTGFTDFGQPLQWHNRMPWPQVCSNPLA